MMIKKKSCLLLFLLLMTWMPVGLARAQDPEMRAFDDSLALAYASHSILLGEVDEEGVARVGGGLMSAAQAGQGDEGKAALGSLIHATKQQRNSLDDYCRRNLAAAKAEGDPCVQQVLQDHCSAQRAKLNRRIGFLHKVRGDQRKFITRVWHSIKRTGERIWHAVGPVGRRILRRAGEEALKVAKSGGSLSLKVARDILIRHAVDVGVEELDLLIKRGIDRFLFGQVALARAAGVQDCTEEELKKAKERLKSDTGLVLEEEEKQECPPYGSWFQSYWDETIYPDLIAEGRNCQRGAVAAYRNCLKEQVVQGMCPLDAVAACEETYQAIPANDGGGTVTLNPDVIHGGAEEISTSLTYPSAGGAVSGSIHYVIHDTVFKCTITNDATITGTYDPTTCTMNGEARMTILYEGMTCVSVCGSGPNSPTACPVTKAGPTTWEATLEDGVLSGGIGGASCEPGCIGFRGEP
jgi:hypothetical protein